MATTLQLQMQMLQQGWVVRWLLHTVLKSPNTEASIQVQYIRPIHNRNGVPTGLPNDTDQVCSLHQRGWHRRGRENAESVMTTTPQKSICEELNLQCIV